jgi:hypothetical protein
LQRIGDMFDQLQGASVFSKINLRLKYHKLKIKIEDVQKTLFRNQCGHYKFLIMPFGLANVPIVFMYLMNILFQNYLDWFVVVFIYDILVYSTSCEDHEDHLLAMFEIHWRGYCSPNSRIVSFH